MTVENSKWTVEREYPHPPAAVFAAWANPAVKVQWFDLSRAEDSNYRSDFRVGGAESFSTPEGASPRFTYDAEYRDLVESERIVFTYEMSMNSRRISVSVATVEFETTETGTRLRFTEQGVYLDGLDTGDSRRIGTTAQLEALGAVLDGAGVRSDA